MKTFHLRVFILLVFLLCGVSLAQHSIKFNPTSFLHKTIKTPPTSPVIIDSIVNISQDWWNNQKLVFNYDTSGKLNYYDVYSNIPGRNTYDYDSLGNLLCQTFTDSRRTYKYDENNNNISQLFERPQISHWVNYIYDTLIYDNTGQLIQVIDKYWLGEWSNTGRTSYFYKNGMVDSISFEGWNGSLWVIGNYTKLLYDSVGQPVTVISKRWNDTLWADYLNCTYTYDQAGNLISGLMVDLSGWHADYRFTYDYNSDNNFVHGTNEAKINGQWTPMDNVFYSSRTDIFDPGLLGTWSDFWFNLTIPSGAELNVYYKINPNYSIESVSDKNNIILKDYSLSQNYPNPFNPSTSIRFTIPSDGLVQLKVYDILGKEVATLVNEYKHNGDYEIKFDARNLSSGIYIYKINSGSFNQSKMMVLLK
jgi:hypothetical protein